MSKQPPDLTISRCCHNCSFFTRTDGAALWGKCKLGDLPIDMYATMICNAHIWKPHGGTTHKILIKLGAKVPEDLQ